MNLTPEELARYHRARDANAALQRDPRHRAYLAALQAEIRAQRQRQNAAFRAEQLRRQQQARDPRVLLRRSVERYRNHERPAHPAPGYIGPGSSKG